MKRQLPPIKRLLLCALCLAALFAVVVAADYGAIPTHAGATGHVDAIIVLGTPADPDGTPSPEQRERTLEGIREYRRGVANYLIMTGGPAHNHFVEAEVMADFAETQGVPAATILTEPQALNTIQNIFYSATLMHAHGWRTAEVVSSPSHLPRASLILATFDRKHPELAIDWRTHAAPWPSEYLRAREAFLFAAEATYCLKLRLFGFPPSRFLPAP